MVCGENACLGETSQLILFGVWGEEGLDRDRLHRKRYGQTDRQIVEKGT